MRKSAYMKVLVPIDGSENSNKALLQACDFAKKYDAKITILYVVEKITPLNLLDKKEYLQMARTFGNKVLKNAATTTVKKGVDSKQILKEGNIVNEITKLAKNQNYNMIIVGSKGLGKTAKFFLGSVSNKLANNSPCSILIVK